MMKASGWDKAVDLAREVRGSVGRKAMFKYGGKIRVGQILDASVSREEPCFTVYVDIDGLKGEEHPKRFRFDKMESEFLLV